MHVITIPTVATAIATATEVRIRRKQSAPPTACIRKIATVSIGALATAGLTKTLVDTANCTATGADPAVNAGIARGLMSAWQCGQWCWLIIWSLGYEKTKNKR